MVLPKQVEEAAQLAEDLHNQLFTGEDPTQVADVPTDEPKDNEVPAEPEAPVVPEEPTVNYEEEFKKAEQRWKTLQGMIEAEKREKDNLKIQLEEIKQSITNRIPETPDPVDDEIQAFENEYGSDFVSQIRKLIAKEAQSITNTAIQPVVDKTESVEQTQIRVAQDNFKNYLDTKVEGDWRTAWSGEDTKFQEFLSKPDPSGLYTYGDLVNIYNDNWDADKLATVFNAYYQESAPKPKPTPPHNKEQDALVAPSRATNQATPQPEDKKVWNMLEVQQFQRDDINGKYTPEQSAALWNDILAAMNEGRIS